MCVDKDPDKIDLVNAGKTPIYERDLEHLLNRNLGGRFTASTNLEQAIAGSTVTLIAVGTPFGTSSIDLSQIQAVAEGIGRALAHKNEHHTVAVKSTVIPGTTDEVVGPLLEKASGKRVGEGFSLAMNPEFLREGEAVADFMRPDRIVIGGSDERAHQALDCVYRHTTEAIKIHTTNRTAEMIKYAANAFFATLISFSNEIGNLCALIEDVDVVDVMQAVHLDRRITPLDGTRRPGLTSYLQAGSGYGGSCFPKDLRALRVFGEARGARMELLEAGLKVNERQPKEVVRLLKKRIPDLRSARVAVLGLAFKPGTSDIRESPALSVVTLLQQEGAFVTLHDPVARLSPTDPLLHDGLMFTPDLDVALQGADSIVLITSWGEYRRLPEMIASMATPPVVVDGRRFLDKSLIAKYEGIGLQSGPR